MKLIDADGLIKRINKLINVTCRGAEGWSAGVVNGMKKALCCINEAEGIPCEVPHVLTREEMIEAGKNHDAVYVEEGVGRCFWGLAVEGIAPPEDKPYNYPGGVQFNVVDADDDMWDGDFYLMCDVYPEKKPHPMGWRACSAKPTDEQMKEVPRE